jgi:uncharacterized protein YbjT (DUF2867 family)
MKDSILVIGGTGTTGQTLIQLLKQSKADFKALVRNEEKAHALRKDGVNVVSGELGNWPSVKEALKDIDSVYLLSSPSFSKVAEQNGLIDMAKKEGVRKIVKLSAVIADTGSDVHLASWHGQIEDHLRSSGLEYINLRAHSFMQNMLMHLGSIKHQDCIYESMGDTKIPMIDTRDVAQASLDCLMRDDLNNATYLVTGPESISYGDMADALSQALNRKINYVKVPSKAHNEGMKTAGLPDWLADDLTKMSYRWDKAQSHQPTSDFNKISNRKQFDVNDFANDYGKYFI